MKLYLIFFSLLGSFTSFCSAQDNPTPVNPRPVISSSTLANSDYQTRLDSILVKRTKLANKIAADRRNPNNMQEARSLLVSSIDDDIFPFWYGTVWDFNGTTQIPNDGKIACGYFVTTVLRDAGIDLNRVKLAQQASENIIKSLIDAKYIHRFSNVSIEKFNDEITKLGSGLYIVGLDFHVGFILNKDNENYFIHSSYVDPGVVVKEVASASPVLSSSKYRVVGKISDDEKFLTKWLQGQKF